jgi:hypothetical protein
MINYLTNPDIVSHEVVEEGWSVKSLLNKIATANPPYHALIDTGALITGMTNFQVRTAISTTLNGILWSNPRCFRLARTGGPVPAGQRPQELRRRGLPR